jgi:hypothetical protein
MQTKEPHEAPRLLNAAGRRRPGQPAGRQRPRPGRAGRRHALRAAGAARAGVAARPARRSRWSSSSGTAARTATLRADLETWAKRLPADVVFKRVPVGFNALYENYQKIFYALEAMGQLELHRKVFAAIHQQRQRLDKEADIAAFMTANGVDGAKFIELYKSFGVQAKAKQAQQLADSLQDRRRAGDGRAGPLLSPPARRPAATSARWPSPTCLIELRKPELSTAALRGRPPGMARSVSAVAFAPSPFGSGPGALWLKWSASFVPHAVSSTPPSFPCPPAGRAACGWPRAAVRPAGDGRKCRPQQAHGRRGRPARQRGPAAPGGHLQRQRRIISQGTMVLRAERVELRETPDGYREATAIGSAGQAGQLPPEARRRR